MYGIFSLFAVEFLLMMGRWPKTPSRLRHRPLAQLLENMLIIPDKPTMRNQAGPSS